MSTETLYAVKLKARGAYFNAGRFLFDAIENIDETNIGLQRNDEFRGIFRTVTTSLVFHRQAADILRGEFNIYFVNSDLEIEIYLKNTTTQVFNLVGVFSIDWKTYKETGTGIEVELTESGLKQVIDTNKDTPYEITFQEGLEGYINVNMIGMYLYGYQEWITAQAVENNIAIAGGEIYPALQASEKYTQYTEITPASSTLKYYSPGPASTTTTFTLIEVNRDGNYVFSGQTFAYYKANSGTITLTLYADRIDSSGTLVTRTILWQDSSPLVATNDRTVNVAFSNKSVLANATDSIRVYFGDRNALTGNINFAIDSKGRIRVDNYFILPEKVVPARRIIQAFSRLVGEMSDFKYTISSNYLNNAAKNLDYSPYLTCYTSGSALRGDEAQYMTLTFSDIWKDIYSRDAVGLCVENEQVVIRYLTELYQANNVIYTFPDEVAELEITPAIDKMFNLLTIGYDTKEVDDENAKYAYNIERKYKSSLRDKFGDKDWKSPFIADTFAIEKEKSVGFQKDTNRRNNDSGETYVLAINANQSGGVYFLNRLVGLGTAYTGFPFDMNPYNFSLSPKRSLIRKAAELASALHKVNAELKLQVQTYSTSIASILTTWVQEYGNYTPTAAPLYQPIYFEFDAKKIPNNFLNLVLNNRYGVLRFRYMGRTFDGFIEEIGVKGREASRYKLLSSPNNVW